MSREIIKKEDGEEVAYRKERHLGLTYDVKIGKLHENLDGSKETRNSFGSDIKVDRKGDFQFNERDGSVDGIEGKFSKDIICGVEIDRHPGFKPNAAPSEKDSSNHDNEYSGSSGHRTTSGVGGNTIANVIMFGILSLFGYCGYLVCNDAPDSSIVNRNVPVYSQPRKDVYSPIVEKNDSIENMTTTSKPSNIDSSQPNNSTLEFAVNNYHNAQDDIASHDNNKRADIYKSLAPSSEFVRSTPPGNIPVVSDIRNNDTVVSQKIEYIAEESAKSLATSESMLYYPKSGKEYPILKSKYPQFYEIVDLDKDGKVSLYEMAQFESAIVAIIAKYPEGDVESIITDFVNMYENKFPR